MNAAVIRAFDVPPGYESFPDPVPEEGEVLVSVTAAGLHPIVKALAKGTHYGSTGTLPFVPGVDGVGRLQDGTRVYFGVTRKPFGTMAERAVASRTMCWPLPDTLDDTVAAAIVNPGMSSWVALNWRAGFVPGEAVLVLGATGVAGQLAAQIARHLGARRVIAAGRSPQRLSRLRTLGADMTISLDQPDAEVVKTLRGEIANGGVDVVIDYVWGQPAEQVIEAITPKGLTKAAPRIRFVQVGESAGSRVSLPASSLRSSGLEILGSGYGSARLDQIMQSVGEFLTEAARGRFLIDLEVVPLAGVDQVWNVDPGGRRLVFQP